MSLQTLEIAEWRRLFSALYSDAKSLRTAVRELRRITEFFGTRFSPSFEAVIEDVRQKPHNKMPCGHAPPFDQVAYHVLMGCILNDYVGHLPTELSELMRDQYHLPSNDA